MSFTFNCYWQSPPTSVFFPTRQVEWISNLNKCVGLAQCLADNLDAHGNLPGFEGSHLTSDTPDVAQWYTNFFPTPKFHVFPRLTTRNSYPKYARFATLHDRTFKLRRGKSIFACSRPFWPLNREQVGLRMPPRFGGDDLPRGSAVSLPVLLHVTASIVTRNCQYCYT